jgi:rhamnose utilization protein RhaD (predicted bifunctional aldolase and dehydrogenase)
MAIVPPSLIEISHVVAEPGLESAILGEGNTSCLADKPGTFWVKASGFSLVGISEKGFILMNSAPLMGVLEADLTDEEVKGALAGARAEEGDPRMPSVESFMHALLLELPGVQMVAHGHPVPLIPLVCHPDAATIAGQRLFPDEIVCCGPAAAFVPYVDPGLPLARAIRDSVMAHADRWGGAPKTIWLGNHGLICLGGSMKEVESAFRMSVKAARVWLAALQMGGWPEVMTPQQVERIAGRPDEHYRQRMLWSGSGS